MRLFPEYRTSQMIKRYVTVVDQANLAVSHHWRQVPQAQSEEVPVYRTGRRRDRGGKKQVAYELWTDALKENENDANLVPANNGAQS